MTDPRNPDRVAPLFPREAEPLDAILRSLRERTPEPARAETFYRDVARAYLALLAAGTNEPVATLTSALRGADRHEALNENTVSAWIRSAREQGWLSPAAHKSTRNEPGESLMAFWMQASKESR
jgi:hypothetical protein